MHARLDPWRAQVAHPHRARLDAQISGDRRSGVIARCAPRPISTASCTAPEDRPARGMRSHQRSSDCLSMRGRSPASLPFLGASGTSGSNPLSSSGESTTNRTAADNLRAPMRRPPALDKRLVPFVVAAALWLPSSEVRENKQVLYRAGLLSAVRSYPTPFAPE
jgi:hypothetical protein